MSVINSNQKNAIEPANKSVYWDRSEKRLWGLMLLLGGTSIYATRFTLPICVAEIAKELGWSKTTSGTVLSCFFWGYACTQIIGGYYSDKIGGEKVMTVIGIGWSLITFWTPQILHVLDFDNYPTFSITFMIFIRVVYGAVQGMHFPATVNVISTNVHPNEKTFFTSIVFCGSSLGIITCGILATWILNHFSWPYVFNFFGALSILWVLVFRFHTIERSKKKVHLISLESNISSSHKAQNSSPKVPWLVVFGKARFWALIFAHFCQSNSWFLIFSWIPSYFHEKFPETPAYIFSSIPYFISIVSSIIAGYLGEYLLQKKLSVTYVRKFVHCISQITMAASLVMFGESTASSSAVFFLCGIVFGGSFSHASTLVNVQDLLPAFAGSMFGVMNTAGSIPGFIGVYTCGYILDTTGSWQLVFNLCAFMNILGLAVFLIFGSGQKIEFIARRSSDVI